VISRHFDSDHRSDAAEWDLQPLKRLIRQCAARDLNKSAQQGGATAYFIGLALGDELVCVALLPVFAQRHETGARGRHNHDLRPPRDNRQQVVMLGHVARCGGLPRENAELALSLVDRRDGHAKPPSIKPDSAAVDRPAQYRILGVKREGISRKSVFLGRFRAVFLLFRGQKTYHKG
jgi:hypothetical protein